MDKLTANLPVYQTVFCCIVYINRQVVDKESFTCIRWCWVDSFQDWASSKDDRERTTPRDPPNLLWPSIGRDTAPSRPCSEHHTEFIIFFCFHILKIFPSGKVIFPIPDKYI